MFLYNRQIEAELHAFPPVIQSVQTSAGQMTH